MNVVVVESPAKAKTIEKYLGPGYTVLASYGHIRDLPSKDGSVRPDDGFAMDWEIDAKARKHVNEIAAALKGADHLYLATDPDREGEAISWHVREVLDQRKSLKGVTVKRVVFNEITKNAILNAFNHPRDLDTELVDAYLARRALDYLVGFTLSPVLWRKLPGSRSAGRVQSVALRLICERETEIENFIAREYWSVAGRFKNQTGAEFTANLTYLDGKKLDKMALGDEASARAAAAAVEAGVFSVASVERKKTRRNPAPPFTTSTLQQEAARKLRFGAKRTMQVAQKLYEGANIGGSGSVGLITYMRTDGVQMAGEAIAACRALIGADFGAAYVPKSPRAYKTKAKNAQEAHEAIRPTDVSRRPDDVARFLNEEQLKLYTLIWRRTVASQMAEAILDQVAVDVASSDKRCVLRATGSVIAFDGFFRLYREGRDDADKGNGGDDQERILPNMNQGESVERIDVITEQHFTQPPPRYSEASLVKGLEELGIGRPSTYASIISVLQDRDYVVLDKRRFVPEDRGRLVTAFLSNFFSRYVEYTFTADLENQLDDISGGRIDWKAVLGEFWKAFSGAVEETRELRIKDVIDALDASLGSHFFRGDDSGADPRACPSCEDGRLSLKLGKFGAFIGCSNYPTCRHTSQLVIANGDGPAEGPADSGPQGLGTDPQTGLEVTLRKGPYGMYVQLGEPEGKNKPKRASLPRGMDPANVTLHAALALLALPRDVGTHPETGEMIVAGLGRFGPYIRHAGAFLSLKGDDDVLSIGLNRAVTLIADAPKRPAPKELGAHPKDKKPVTVRSGRYGPYVQHGALRATLPKAVSSDDVTLEQAIEFLAAKAGKGGKKAPAKKAAAKKPAKKKPSTRGAAKSGTAKKS
jgi:DNA topoisomerase I